MAGRGGKKFVLCGVLLLGGVLAISLWPADPMTAIEAPPAMVRVSEAGVQDVPISVRGMGTVRSFQDVDIRTQIDGQLVDILVSEGQDVEQGALLARIDDRGVRAALAQAQATLAVNRAQLQSARLDLRRYESLLPQNSVPRQQYEQQQARVQELEAAIAASQAMVSAEEVRLSYTEIRSPVSGRVGIRNVDVGNIVRTSDSSGLFSVTQLSPVSVEFSLPQHHLPVLQALTRHETRLPVLVRPRSQGDVLASGHLMQIDNRVRAQSGTVRARAHFDNDDGRLWPGQFVTVDLQTDMLRNVVVVPAAAVRRGEQGHYVYRVEGEQAAWHGVTVRHSGEDYIVVEGLPSGSRVVYDGHFRLRDGTPVTVMEEPLAARDVALERAL